MTTFAEHEKAIIEGADYFMVCDFIGRAEYNKDVAPSRNEAVEKARNMIAARTQTIYNKGRPILVYAIKGVHSVVAETVYPNGRLQSTQRTK